MSVNRFARDASHRGFVCVKDSNSQARYLSTVALSFRKFGRGHLKAHVCVIQLKSDERIVHRWTDGERSRNQTLVSKVTLKRQLLLLIKES